MRRGFSLVELSIVLVVLGLVVGGVMVGQNLIRASELRGVVTQLQQYTIAVEKFRETYNGLPGDLYNATKFWGTAAVCPGTQANPKTDARTCNGDGDRAIEFGAAQERYLFWQQLSNAGLIEGKYTGVRASSAGDNTVEAGVNTPQLSLNNAGVAVVDAASLDPVGYYSQNLMRHVLHIHGGELSTVGTSTNVFTPEESYYFDDKMDDGKPGTGKITSRKPASSGSPLCSTNNNPDAARYNMNVKNEACVLVFMMGF
tara:strand:+ start:1175 stop:1945 length:771 start_codon:yes stop_codon:yes gene_type:complete